MNFWTMFSSLYMACNKYFFVTGEGYLLWASVDFILYCCCHPSAKWNDHLFCFQLYNAYVETQDQLLLEKLENKRINKYLDEIVKEVEAKAPILKRQREEYERAQKAVASLSAKLEQAMKVGSISELQLCTVANKTSFTG